MIKLSDVKVRPQYRTRVRYRLVVLEYAWAQGPAAAGRHYRISPRTIRRWRKRWRSSGVEGLVATHPPHRPRRVSPRGHRANPPPPPGARPRGGTHATLAATPARGSAGHGHDPTGVSRRG